jgi:hypothetical protein
MPARDVAALARVWQELAREAGPRGLRALVASRFGPVPDAEPDAEPETEPETEPDPETGPDPDLDPETDPLALIDRFAALHGLSRLTVSIDIRPGMVSRTHTLSPGVASATFARGDDELATCALALHEFGHALLRAHTRSPFDPPRWLDEAVAAWAVRGLEDPALVADPAIRAESRRRRLARESTTARLAAFEAQAKADPSSVPTAWPADLDPAAFPVLFDEPGVMACYAAADRWPRPILPRKVRR